jgi:hypothetical protein
MNIVRSIALCCMLLALPSSAVAHHSFSMYDSEKLVLLEGTIKEFQWTNPHAILWVTGSATPGQAPELWTVELPTSPGNLTRMGWKRSSLSPGDKVVVEINPLRDGRRGGSFKKATLTSTGVVLVANVRDEPPNAGGAPGEKTHDHEENDHHPDDEHKSCSLAHESHAGHTGLLGLACFAVAASGRRLRRVQR